MWIEHFRKHRGICEAMKDMPYPDRFSDEVIASLVDYVTVHDEKRVEIKWNFSDYAIAELLAVEIKSI